jgi:hypothetical protein
MSRIKTREGAKFSRRKDDILIYTFIDGKLWRFESSLIKTLAIQWYEYRNSLISNMVGLRYYGLALSDFTDAVLFGGQIASCNI